MMVTASQKAVLVLVILKLDQCCWLEEMLDMLVH